MFAATYAFLWCLAIVQGLVIVALVREVGELKGRLPARSFRPERGAKAPDFSAADLQSDSRMSLRDLGRSPVVLCFLSSTCLECRRLSEELARESPEVLSKLILLCQGDRSEVARRFGVLSQRIRTLYAEDYGAFVAAGFPAAYVLDGHGFVTTVIAPVTVKELRLASTSLMQSTASALQPA